jgi:hypothetical protein
MTLTGRKRIKMEYRERCKEETKSCKPCRSRMSWPSQIGLFLYGPNLRNNEEEVLSPIVTEKKKQQ